MTKIKNQVKIVPKKKEVQLDKIQRLMQWKAKMQAEKLGQETKTMETERKRLQAEARKEKEP
eukprot:UN11646